MTTNDDQQQEKKQTALLVGVHKDSMSRRACEEHLDELALLADTFGVDVADRMCCHVRKFDASTLVGSGKIEEFIELIKEKGVDMIIFDDEISPAQQRNLEKLIKCPVMDRTELIIGVFDHHAHTKEARLQVDLARERYQLPRLKRLWTHLERQAGSSGGGKYLKGMGEKQIEVDRRLIEQRIATLQREIKKVRAHRETQRHAREKSEIPTFAIVGYTNAGKSTLLNALTDAGVLVEDKLFATLDTTTRKFTLSNNQDVLLIDTVGFIRKLPHQLVAAFKSTLEETAYADILLNIVDVSDPYAEDHTATAMEVLKGLDMDDKPIITILNKTDKVEGSQVLQKFRIKYPKTVPLVAVSGEGFDHLQERMVEELKKWRKVLRLRVPQSDYAIVTEVMREGNILHQDYEGNDVLLHVDLPARYLGKLEKYVEEVE